MNDEPISIGEDRDERPVDLHWNLVGNLLVTGQTKTGKSKFANLIGHTLTASPDWKLFGWHPNTKLTPDHLIAELEAAAEYGTQRFIHLPDEREAEGCHLPAVAILDVAWQNCNPVQVRNLNRLAAHIAQPNGVYGVHLLYIIRDVEEAPALLRMDAGRATFHSSGVSFLQPGQAWFTTKDPACNGLITLSKYVPKPLETLGS